jgi:hypothetical protein
MEKARIPLEQLLFSRVYRKEEKSEVELLLLISGDRKQPHQTLLYWNHIAIIEANNRYSESIRNSRSKRPHLHVSPRKLCQSSLSIVIKLQNPEIAVG